ncbi:MULTISPECIES: glycosyltransferase family 4 protein [Bradyrhizobium]|uniref:Glycosyltransferase family 4 protein n=1 Tax=Bradyrhizobium barranii subsp. barranii TaxID=2823807 RepID=A0A939MFT3_9BRAD|nr:MULTISPECIES: glycosyltransferase family 4 protein [Bradyrhizobium]MBR0884057.1 glycosyltransferase family 4 protein [Bradyrhizobium liaoningense]MBR0947761.1 glycosyltransferase family 4 protein [Bradyrhizobium liaoningense]MBR1004231.1 glycosyltransferase family 4 protein [Bradyrhizobium liaoningense]MBR1070508.1 glycosyltransferase family 4 protein [Bradyrhizobium liaoningense]MCD9825377.1 glycosyltransferase family 4 protein [Bradyrhizobium japonicum]
MRVLHFYKTYVPDSCGGVEQVIYQLARGSALLGHTVDVLSLSCSGPKGPSVFDNHTAHRARLAFEIASTGFSFSVIRTFAALAREADIIHYHFPWPFLDVVHFATQVSKPTVLTYHSDIVRQRTLLKLYRPLMMRLLGSVDQIVATSPNYLATSDVLSKFCQKARVIPIGLDRATYPEAPSERLADWRAQIGDRFFLFVGALRYYKGLHVLLDAIQGTELPVVIVGSGPMEQELRKHSARLNLPGVHFLGWLPDEDKVALIRLCLAVVFPSHLRSEAFGISLVEGAMFGKPLISSEIGTGTTFVNIHGETGLVVPPNDADAFRRAMIYLAGNPIEAERMGQNAGLRYQGLFRAEQMVARYTALYHELWTASAARR